MRKKSSLKAVLSTLVLCWGLASCGTPDELDVGQLNQALSGDANCWTDGEIRNLAVNSVTDFGTPAGLGDAKASLGSVCARNTHCACRDGSKDTAPADKAAWNNIIKAGGTDKSGGAYFMCVGTTGCYFVTECYDDKKGIYVKRKRLLTTSGTTTVKATTLYFYPDSLKGHCPADN